MSEYKIAANCMSGQKKDGAHLGPSTIYYDYDLDIACEKFKNGTGYQDLYDGMTNLLESDKTKRAILIGGDHSVACASISAINDHNIKNKNEPLTIIWIDAHADINTYETSVTKNIHGMPVAFLMRLCEQNHVKFNNALLPQNIVYVGLRDVDPPEWEFLKQLNIEYYDMDKINEMGINNVIDMLKKKVGNNRVHISLDIDGMDPEYAPSTGTAVPEGLSVDNVISIIQTFKRDKLMTMDIVELNPLIGTKEDVQTTINNINKCISAFSKLD